MINFHRGRVSLHEKLWKKRLARDDFFWEKAIWKKRFSVFPKRFFHPENGFSKTVFPPTKNVFSHKFYLKETLVNFHQISNSLMDW